MTEVDLIQLIIEMLGNQSGQYSAGVIRYSIGRIQIADSGFSYTSVFENGSWYISGEARLKVMTLLNSDYMLAKAEYDLRYDEAARLHELRVEKNNALVLKAFNDPKAATQFLNG